MYICNKHGELANGWCDECGEIVKCDCSKLTETRFKDLIFDCDDGERTVTIYIEHCETCGSVFGCRPSRIG